MKSNQNKKAEPKITGQIIKHLEFNRITLPKSIYDYFKLLGLNKEPIYGELELTEKGTSHHCFVLMKDFNLFKSRLSKGAIKDDQGTVLNIKTINSILISYSKGFNEGYNSFVSGLKSNNELFENSNTDLAYKIIERVIPSFISAKDGNINKFGINLDKIDMPEYISNDMLFKAGFEGGEYYKAWELILNSPKLFEKFFNEVAEKRSGKLAEIPPQLEVGKVDNINTPAEYNIDFWNKECFELFKHLAENYNATAKKQKFINIWLYLKYNTKDNLVFTYGKEKYKTYVTTEFKFDFSKAKINKPNNFDNQLTILHNHYTNYCNKLKALK